MRKPIFIALFILTLTGQQAIAQTTGTPEKTFGNKYGLFGGINLNMHTSDFHTLPGYPICCPHFLTGKGTGFTVGALAEFNLSDLFFLGVRGSYTAYDALLSEKENTTFIMNGTAYKDGEFEYRIDSKLGNAGLDVMLGVRLFAGLALHVGGRAGLNISGTFDQVEELTNPSSGATFIDPVTKEDSHSRTRNKFSGDIPDLNSFQASLLGGISYDLPLNSEGSLWLSPEVFYSFGLTDIVKDSNWKANSLRLGLAVKYQPLETVFENIRHENIDTLRLPNTNLKEETLITGIPNETSSVSKSGNREITTTTYSRTDTLFYPKKLRLLSDITAVGIDSTGKEVPNPKFVVEEFVSNRLDPLLNYVFFDENSSLLGRKYRKLNSSEADGFSVSNLYSDSTLGIYYSILNIVGSRLRQYPDAKLKLVGCNAAIGTEKDNRELSKKRAETVKEYLVTNWAVKPERISIEVRDLPEKASVPIEEPMKAEENRRVELYSNNYEILKPVTTTDTLRSVNPPVVRFKPSTEAEAGVDNWKLTVSQTSAANDAFSRESSVEAVPSSIDWQLNKEQRLAPHSLAPFIYNLKVTDKVNQSVKTSDQKLDMEIITIEKKRTMRIGDMEIDKYSLILFDFDKSDISGSNKKITDYIKSRIKPNSTIEILGYTDILGMYDYNKSLSQRRADAVKTLLGRSDVTVKAYGEDENMYDNSSPEGRFYCRTVVINVQTPVE